MKKQTDNFHKEYFDKHNNRWRVRGRIDGVEYYCTRYDYVYLKATGQWDKGIYRLPKGYVIHHIDGDTTHDVLSNLLYFTSKEHRALHDFLNNDSRKVALRLTISKQTNKGTSKKVKCIETGIIYPSYIAAAKAVGGKIAWGMNQHLNHGQATFMGKHWEKVEENVAAVA